MGRYRLVFLLVVLQFSTVSDIFGQHQDWLSNTREQDEWAYQSSSEHDARIAQAEFVRQQYLKMLGQKPTLPDFTKPILERRSDSQFLDNGSQEPSQEEQQPAKDSFDPFADPPAMDDEQPPAEQIPDPETIESVPAELPSNTDLFPTSEGIEAPIPWQKPNSLEPSILANPQTEIQAEEPLPTEAERLQLPMNERWLPYGQAPIELPVAPMESEKMNPRDFEEGQSAPGYSPLDQLSNNANWLPPIVQPPDRSDFDPNRALSIFTPNQVGTDAQLDQSKLPHDWSAQGCGSSGCAPCAVPSVRDGACSPPYCAVWCEPQYYVSVFGGVVQTSCFSGSDQALNQDVYAFRDGGAVGAGLGQLQGKNLRSELEFCYRGNDIDAIQLGNSMIDTGSIEGNLTSYAGMGNAYWEFGACLHRRLRPYIGGGVGFVFIDVDFEQEGQPLFVNGYNADSSFAYQFMGGANLRITPSVDIFAEYRYFAADEIKLRTQAGVYSTMTGEFEYETDNVLFGVRLRF